MTVLLTWLINALALLIITYLVPSIHIRSFGTALIVAVVLGLINTILRPVLILLTLPVTSSAFSVIARRGCPSRSSRSDSSFWWSMRCASGCARRC